MAKAKGLAAKPPSPIPLQLFGPQQQALFDALVATAKSPAEPPSSSPPKARAAVKARPAKKKDGQYMEVDATSPMEVDAKPPQGKKKAKRAQGKKKKDPEDETTASEGDAKAGEAKRKKKAVVKEAKVLKMPKKSGSKVSNVFYKAVADDAGDLTSQDVKKVLLATQRVIISGLKDNGKSRISSFLTFKTKQLKERPARKDKNMFGRVVTLQPRPAKKAALNKRQEQTRQPSIT